MNRIVAFVLTVGGIVFGFTYGGGRLSALFHFTVFLPVATFIIGALVLGFGYAAPWRMAMATWRGACSESAADLQLYALICECASRAAWFGASVACLLGLLNVVCGINADVSRIGEHLAAATTAPIVGGLISALVFSPLKHRFLRLRKERDMGATREPLPRPTPSAVIKAICLWAIAVALSLFLIGAYMSRIVPYLERILRR